MAVSAQSKGDSKMKGPSEVIIAAAQSVINITNVNYDEGPME